MKAKILLQGLARAGLLIVLLGSGFGLPNQLVLAKPDLASFTNCAAQSQIPAAECEALLLLYQNADGVDWWHGAGWLQTDTPCSWYGVTCANGSNVTSLDLFDNALTGSIPLELGNLTHLTYLDLAINRLSGSIPAQLGNLTQLTYLNLGWNHLGGVIPAGLGNLTRLTSLDLSRNSLIGPIPTWLGSLTNLTDLALYGNLLSGSIPAELGGLTRLTRLRLAENRLSASIPPQLGSLTHLELLDLHSNRLSGSIPAGLGNLKQLAWLDLSFNQLSASIPAGLGSLTNLAGLNLSFNALSGSIPPQLGNLIHLEGLDLNHNALSGSLPASLGRLSMLNELYLDHNALAGEIPASIVDLTRLRRLSLSCGLDSSNPTVIAFLNVWLPGWQNNLCLPLVTLTSIAGQDGWIIESSENSNRGGTQNSSAATFNLGDNAARRQYLGILSFGSGAALPDTAVITQVTLKVKRQGVSGVGDPPVIFQGFLLDIKNGFFGATSVLQIADFQAAANKTFGPFTPAPVSNWYTFDLTGAKDYVNKLTASSGLTQIRLRFKLDDNNDAIANVLSLFSGSAPVVSRPQLMIQYYVP